MGSEEKIREAVESGRVVWRRHAFERMLERAISRSEVCATVRQGEIIESDDTRHPFPIYLWFAMIKDEPLHAAVAFDAKEATAYIVTAYRPALDHFEDDFKTRKKQ